MVRFEFCLPGLGGLAATAGPAQMTRITSAALIFLISPQRAAHAQVGYGRRRGARRRLPYQLVAPAGAVEPVAPPFDAGVVGLVYSNSSSAPKSVSSAFLRRPSLRTNASPTP